MRNSAISPNGSFVDEFVAVQKGGDFRLRERGLVRGVVGPSYRILDHSLIVGRLFRKRGADDEVMGEFDRAARFFLVREFFVKLLARLLADDANLDIFRTTP